MLISFPFWTPNDFNAQKPKCPPHQKSLQPKESNILKEKGDVSLLLMVTIIRWNEISSCFNTMREYGVLGHLCHLRVCVCVSPPIATSTTSQGNLLHRCGHRAISTLHMVAALLARHQRPNAANARLSLQTVSFSPALHTCSFVRKSRLVKLVV